MKKLATFTPILVSIFIAQGAGLLGAVFTMSSLQSWYPTLVTPEWNPPSWVFGPVWTILYTLMGISAYLIWKTPQKAPRKTALTLYGIQLLLNALWSILFFGFQNIGLAFAEILILWTTILLVMILFWRIHKTAGLLLLPYLAWVSFAAFLNYTLWQLNS